MPSLWIAAQPHHGRASFSFWPTNAESDLNARTVELASELCLDRVHRMVTERVSFKMETELAAMAQSMLKDAVKDAMSQGVLFAVECPNVSLCYLVMSRTEDVKRCMANP